MSGDTSQERTEQATEKRMKDVRQKGQLQKSTDLTAWVGMGAAGLVLPLTLQRASNASTDQVFTIRTVAENPEPDRALQALGDALGSLAGTLAPLMTAVVLAILVAAGAQNGIRFKKFKGHYEQFDVVKGSKRVFGGQAWWNGLKALLKTTVVGAVLYVVVQSMMPLLLGAGGLPVSALLSAAGGGVASLLQFAVAAGLVLAVADVAVVMKRNRKKSRMTKKEVKDENKNSEGDPLIKSQRRARQLALSRNRMIAAVGESDVVLVNPTHVAVALKYEPGKSAPRVVAKGADHIATRIRQEAEATGVPMVRDVPLARALHGACEVGHEIPAELYDAVARVLAFVMSLTARGAAAGTHVLPQPALTPELR